jgi:hypothetical protein
MGGMPRGEVYEQNANRIRSAKNQRDTPKNGKRPQRPNASGISRRFVARSIVAHHFFLPQGLYQRTSGQTGKSLRL